MIGPFTAQLFRPSVIRSLAWARYKIKYYSIYQYVCFFCFSNIIEVVDGRMLVFDPKEDREDFFYQGQKQKRRDLNKKENRDQKFAFDVVFGPNANNEDVYAGTVIQNQ